MATKGLAQLAVAIIFAVGLIVLTGMKIMPTEVLASFIGVAVTWVYKEKEKEREISRLMGGKR